MDSQNDLLSASLESIDSTKRVGKYQKFITDFRRECEVSLDNAQEWIKAELPIVTKHIDLAQLKDELKAKKTTGRRKHLLSALIYEQAARNAVQTNQASLAAIAAMHMMHQVWQAKIEVYEAQTGSFKIQDTNLAEAKPVEEEPKNKEILTSLIAKSEKRIRDSQIIQTKSAPKKSKPKPAENKSNHKKATEKKETPAKQKINTSSSNSKDLWAETKESTKRTPIASKKKKQTKKTKSVLSKVRSKIAFKNGQEKNPNQTGMRDKQEVNDAIENDSLLDNPNNSAIIVNTGFAEDLEKLHEPEKSHMAQDPNDTGITVQKISKNLEHKSHSPGSNTIIMKLSSGGSSRKKNENLSIPEQCQEAVNLFCKQFPGYDIVAIRNLAAEKVGVSPQYIENLNIIPEQ